MESIATAFLSDDVTVTTPPDKSVSKIFPLYRNSLIYFAAQKEKPAFARKDPIKGKVIQNITKTDNTT